MEIIKTKILRHMEYFLVWLFFAAGDSRHRQYEGLWDALGRRISIKVSMKPVMEAKTRQCQVEMKP